MSHAISGHAEPVGAHRPAALGRDLVAGAIAGQIAGLVMAVVVMAVFTVFLGKGPLFPVQVIGSTVFGEAALQGVHVGALVAGLLLHQLGPALLWGLLFGLLVNRLDVRGGPALAVVAVVVGLASQVVDVNLIVPLAMKALHGRDLWAENVPAPWSWAAHLVFGLGLLSFPAVAARLAGARGARS
jgi:hypothetical protein